MQVGWNEVTPNTLNLAQEKNNNMFESLPKPVAPLLAILDNQQQNMLDATIELAKINSGSFNADGVNRVLKRLRIMAASLGGKQEILELPPFEVVNNQGELVQHSLGNALRIRKRPEAPVQVFLCGHMDTVFAVDHPFQSIKWLDKNTINGPGVTDLKGGILIMLKALDVLEQSPWAEQIGWGNTV